MSLRHSALAALWILSFAACRSEPSNTQTFAGDDPEMNAAISRARATMPAFLARFSHPTPTQTYASIKMRVGNELEGEHFWLDSLKFDGHEFIGRLDDDPVSVMTVHRGDVERVAPGEISDWLVIDGKQMCGGFTIRVARRHQSSREAAIQDSTLGVPATPTDTTLCSPESH